MVPAADPARRSAWAVTVLGVAALLAALIATGVGSAAPAAACSFCGKNLVLNPGAEAGKGLNAAGANGNVPHWTNAAGQFGAAACTGFGVGWVTAP